MSLEPPATVPCPRCAGEGGWEIPGDVVSPGVYDDWEDCDLCEGAKVVPLTVICAWKVAPECTDLLRGPALAGSGYRQEELRWVVSHGLCQPCKAVVEAEAERDGVTPRARS